MFELAVRDAARLQTVSGLRGDDAVAELSTDRIAPHRRPRGCRFIGHNRVVGESFDRGVVKTKRPERA